MTKREEKFLEELQEVGLYVDEVRIKKDKVTVRKGFFYTHGKTATDLEDRVMKAVPKANIIESGEIRTSFKGSAGVTRNSHWYVTFTM